MNLENASNMILEKLGSGYFCNQNLKSNAILKADFLYAKTLLLPSS